MIRIGGTISARQRIVLADITEMTTIELGVPGSGHFGARDVRKFVQDGCLEGKGYLTFYFPRNSAVTLREMESFCKNNNISYDRITLDLPPLKVTEDVVG